MNQSRESKLVKNTVILAIGTFFPKLAVFITLPVLTGYLTKVEYGTYDLVLTLVSLLLPAATLQIQTAAFRFLIERRDQKEEIRTIISNIYAFILPISMVVLVVLYCVLWSQPTLIRIEICLYFLFDILSGATRQIVRGVGKNSLYTMSAFVSAVSQIACVFLFVWFAGWGLAGAILALCIGEFGSLICLLLKGNVVGCIDMKLVNKACLKSLLAYSWPMVPNSLSMWVMRVSDRFVITAVMGVAVNAVYAVAYRIPSILNLAHNTFNMAWQESASIASKDSDANAFFSKIFRDLYDITTGMLSALIGVTPLLFVILVRGDYGEAYNQIIVLYLAIFFCALSSFWGGLYVAYQKTKSVGFTAVLAALINLVVDIALIKWIGLYAASGSTLVSYLFLCVFRMIDTRKFLNIHYDYKHIFITLVILIAQCIVCAQRVLALDVINFIAGVCVFVVLNRDLMLSYWNRFTKKVQKLKN